jgi:EF-P beta-lysylation protein EpmB
MGSDGMLAPKSKSWKLSLQQAIRSLGELLDVVDLSRDQLPPLDESPDFPLLVPREFAARMKRGDPSDPLLLQVLPLASERESVAGYSDDAVGDSNATKSPGLIHKYPTRALLVASGMCAVNCRYCFRRHFPYDEAPKSLIQWHEALGYIAEHPQIQEVILSGGDPLSLGNSKLFELLRAANQISHVQRIRIHTRFPVMIPSRIDTEFLEEISAMERAIWMVLHINHVREIDQELCDALKGLRRAGVILMNQAVLLRGVNDTFEAQRDLCVGLVNAGVQPYYLHQLDRVGGAAHFESDVALGEQIVDRLRSELSGYAVPRFVREVAGESSKTLIR